MPEPQEKTLDAIRAVVSKLDGLGRLRLIKMLFLADVEARKQLGHPITDLGYYVDDFGPFDKALYGHVARLRTSNEVTEEQYTFEGGKTGSVYSYRGAMPESRLSPAENRILSWVVETYGRLPRRELLEEHVYSTKPWQRANREQPLSPVPMECVNNEGRLSFHGFSLEKAMASDRAFANGESVSLAALCDELRRIHPEDSQPGSGRASPRVD